MMMMMTMICSLTVSVILLSLEVIWGKDLRVSHQFPLSIIVFILFLYHLEISSALAFNPIVFHLNLLLLLSFFSVSSFFSFLPHLRRYCCLFSNLLCHFSLQFYQSFQFVSRLTKKKDCITLQVTIDILLNNRQNNNIIPYST